jgi:hypothetical protein
VHLFTTLEVRIMAKKTRTNAAKSHGVSPSEYPKTIDFQQYNGQIVTSGNTTRPLPWYLVDRGKCRVFSRATRDWLFRSVLNRPLVLLDPDEILANTGDPIDDNIAIVRCGDSPYYLLDRLSVGA